MCGKFINNYVAFISSIQNGGNNTFLAHNIYLKSR